MSTEKEKKTPNTNDPDYFNKIEKAYQKKKVKEAVERDKQNRRLGQKIEEVKARLPEATKEAVKQQIRAQTPSSLGLGLDTPDETLVEAETDCILNEMATPIALKELQEGKRGRIGYKQQSPLQELGDRDQNRMWLLEVQQNIAKIRRQRDKFKLIPFGLLILNMDTATALSSFLNTNNNLGYELAQSGIQINSFETLPTCKPKQIAWIKAVYDGKILNDNILNEALKKIAAAIRNLARPIIL